MSCREYCEVRCNKNIHAHINTWLINVFLLGLSLLTIYVLFINTPVFYNITKGTWKHMNSRVFPIGCYTIFSKTIILLCEQNSRQSDASE